jgi:SsrA-binding protein
MAKKQRDPTRKIVNRKARHEYFIHETVEAGIVLTGTEVKSLRAGQAQLTEAFVRIHRKEATLYGCQIERYPPAAEQNHDPKRNRRLLLHGRELRKLSLKLQQQGATLVPLSIYFNRRGLVKLELALVTGKKQYDKRQALRKRDHQREIERATHRRRRR